MKRQLINFIALPLICLTFFLSNAPNGEMEETKPQTEKPPMFVFQVGIRKYKNSKTWQELKGAETDVTEMTKVLQGKRFNVSKENFVEPLFNEKATKQNIFSGFESLIAKVREYSKKNSSRRDAVVLFQFSGHGTRVPDVAPNKDETDGYDEALVTVDSENVQNKNYDITDDEIYLFTKELGKYTENIVFILDSCYSGTGTRGGGETRSVEPRTTQPVFVPLLGSKKNAVMEKKDGEDNKQTDLLPFSNNYVVISGAQAGEHAGEYEIFEDGGSLPTAHHGRMTYFLLKNLREAVDTTTYANLMDSVRRDVLADSSGRQTPQIEGKSSRAVFGGLGEIEDNTIPILIEAETKKTFLEAGAMQGVTKGTILEIRSKTGDKIGKARVLETGANRSFFQTTQAVRELSADDRAVIFSHDSTAKRLRVLLDGEDASKITVKEKEIVEKVQAAFIDGERKTSAIEITRGKWNERPISWDVALLKDRFDKVFPKKSRAAPVILRELNTGELEYDKFPSGEKEVFYFVGKDLTPLYGFYVEADKDYTQRVLEVAVSRLSQLRSVKAIENDNSPLHGKVQITPVRLGLPINCNKNVMMPTKREVLPPNPSDVPYKFNIGEPYMLEITNNSGADVYITLLDIAPDGSVKILYPLNEVGEPSVVKLEGKAGKNKKYLYSNECVRTNTGYFPPYYFLTPPAGIETFKLIVSTDPIERSKFQFLEIPPLGAIPKGEQVSLTDIRDWTTAEINFELVAPQE